MRVLTTWLFRGYVFREGEAVSAKTVGQSMLRVFEEQ